MDFEIHNLHEMKRGRKDATNARTNEPLDYDATIATSHLRRGTSEEAEGLKKSSGR
jgi:hypothetical protein